MPHWLVQGDAEGRWSTQMHLRITHNNQPSVLAEQMFESMVIANQSE